jgi:hypothetical protein
VESRRGRKPRIYYRRVFIAHDPPDRFVTGLSKVDIFNFPEIVDDNGRKVRRSTVTTDLLNGSINLLHCFVKPFDPESGDVENNLYSLKKECKYFVHQSTTGDNQRWKLFLPLEVTSYAVRDSLEEEIRKVIYDWTAMEHPFIKKVNSYYCADGPAREPGRKFTAPLSSSTPPPSRRSSRLT